MLVDFYHLASSPLERVLPRICERIIADGERLLIVAEPDLLGQLDSLLWSYGRDSFLPHGRSDKPGAERQPILLSATPEPINGADNIALADGEWREQALAFKRTFYFFDGNHLDMSRATWRALKDKVEVESRFWKQDEGGKWVQGP